MRTPIIAGNWKMQKTIIEATGFIDLLKNLVKDVDDVDIVVAPPATALATVGKLIPDSNIKLSAQNMHWLDSGAATGEISPLMLAEIGCTYTILGHSERRTDYGETNEGVNKRLKTALAHNITPIICIGESLAQREAQETFTHLAKQLDESLAGLTPEQMQKVVLAYEPIWAIGTGLTASPEQAEEVHAFIRDELIKLFGEETAESVRIQYGGSVKPDNVAGLMAKPNIDGALVGGAALQAESFAKLVKFKDQ